ncbi:O-antigen ligase family protein [Shewanella japonica]|uniref:O-antigen ligase family protein n=1 Tax=Shewanella japonica TaxID=93973 RepID=UPI000E72089F|nr:O-antigen ligase family protein [Shewanella japonica]
MDVKAYSKIVFFSCGAALLMGTLFSIKLSQFTGVTNEYDLKRLLVIVCLSIFSIFLIFVKNVEFRAFSREAKILAAIAICAVSYSSIISKHPFFSFVEVINYGLLLIAFGVFTVCIRALKIETFYFSFYIYVLLFSIFTLSKYLLFLLFFYIDAKGFNINGLIYGYVNVRFFNQLQVMLIPMLFFPIFKSSYQKYITVSILILSLHWVVLLQSEARGAILSLICASGLICFFISRNNRRKFISTSAKGLALGIMFWLIFIIIIPSWLMDIENLQLRTSSSGRIDLWLFSLKSVMDSVWFGFGPMSFAWAEGKPLYNAHPHNSVVQLLYECGLITCSILVIGVIYYLSQSMRKLREEKLQMNAPALLSFLAGIIYSLFSGIIVMPFSQIMLVFFAAVIYQKEGASYNRIEINVLIILLISTLIGCYVILSTYQHEQLLPALFPRMWLHGLIG